MTILRVLPVLAAFVLAACGSSIPTTADMQRFYEAAEKQAQRDIDRLVAARDRGEISPEEYQRREEAIKKSIPQRAGQMAWARHELTESQLRGMSIPTGDTPVQVGAPGRGSAISGSFYRQPGQTGVMRGYQPGSMASSSTLRNYSY